MRLIQLYFCFARDSWLRSANEETQSVESRFKQKMESAAAQQQKLSDLGLFSSNDFTDPNLKFDLCGPEDGSNPGSRNSSTDMLSNGASSSGTGNDKVRPFKALFKDDDVLRSAGNLENELRSVRESESEGATSSGARRSNAVENDTYEVFCHKLMSPRCDNLRNALKRFLLSIMGPRGDGSPPPPAVTKKDKELQDYIFHGTDQLARRCCDFLDAMKEHFEKHVLWKDQSPEQQMLNRDHLENYVMTIIHDVAFKSVELPEDDAFLRYALTILI